MKIGINTQIEENEVKVDSRETIIACGKLDESDIY